MSGPIRTQSDDIMSGLSTVFMSTHSHLPTVLSVVSTPPIAWKLSQNLVTMVVYLGKSWKGDF